MARSKLLSVALLGLSTLSARADDWPQFRGPQRDGISLEKGLLKEWPKGGPKLLWTYNGAGLGYSGPAVIGDRLYLSGGREETEYLIALNIKDIANNTVKEEWAAKIGPLFQWKGNNWNFGPNASPTVSGDSIFALGGAGELLCVETKSGKETWRKNIPTALAGEVNPIGGGAEKPTPLGWGYACAPLMDGDQLVCTPGGPKGLLAALNKKTGDVIWQSKEITDQAPYSSPLAVEVGGIKQYVQVTNMGIHGIAAKDGKKLWSYIRQPAYDDVVITTPIFSDNHVFSTVGFQQGCDLVKLVPQDGAIKAEKVFSNKNVENRDGGVVLVDGHLYGHSENKGWFCQEFKTGKVVWSDRESLGRGSITYADGNLYCCSEKGGIVVIVEASPKGWNERGRLKLPAESKLRRPSGMLWTHPVISNGKLYIRDQELLYCFDLKP
ncbi:MAG: PQQ-like beta-propeller repeat protein [Planctomycetes bacterium]|nr:PQQ-like beta-propeller repeat protein [Planctomycetota bacterium]